MILFKIQALSHGHSGVQLVIVERLIEFYNNDITPVIYEQGSLGASGDLSPLAHLALPLIGLGEVYYKNMEIITIVQSGALKHEDSMGNKGVIEAGDIQVMSAGSGIEHSEVNASSQNSLTLFQLWIHSQRQDVTPRYEQKKIAPLLTDNAFTTIVKPKQEALKDDIWIHQQAYISIGNFSDQTQTNYSMQQSQNGVYIMVIEGSIVLADQTLQHRDAIGLWNTNSVDMTITKNSKVLVVEVPMI